MGVSVDPGGGNDMAEEKNYENKIKKLLDKLPNTWYFKHWAGPYSKAGIPDIIACIDGHFVGIEVKASSGRASKLQEVNMSKIKRAGGHGYITYPKDFNELKRELEGLSGAGNQCGL